MKKTWYMMLGVLAVAALLAAVPVHAASISLSDSDLAAISGKSASVDGTALTANVDFGDANSQTGSYTWNDSHTNDANDHKGANDTSGATSAVQQNVVASSNLISWGAASVGTGVVGTASAGLDQSGTSSATQHIGGF